MTPTLPTNCFRKQWRAALDLLLVLAISAGLSAQADAHSGGRVYPIAYLSDEMLAGIQLDDGAVDEWTELIGEPTMTSLDFTDISGERTPDPSDLDFRIWLAWHDDPARFYVAFVAIDDLYKNNHSYGVRRPPMRAYDSISLAIDGDHSGGAGGNNNFSPEEWLDAKGRTQNYEAIARTVDGPILDDLGTRVNSENFAWNTLPPYGEGGGGVAGENPTISVIELYVTPFDQWGGGWDSAGNNKVSDLEAEKVIGFGVSVIDWDLEDEGRMYWIPEAMSDEKDPDLAIDRVQADVFLDGLLLSDAEPKDTAVESVSWGRIKASLQME